jgi:transposase InsO family protein
MNDALCRKKPLPHSSKSEFFLDEESALYRRRNNGKHHLVIQKALIQDVIRENLWWPNMRKSIEDYIRNSDPCQRRKSLRKQIAPLGEVDMPTYPFEITALDITGSYPLTLRKNRFLLTFVDHFTRYVEAYPVPDITAETCARIYATQIVTRHGSGSKLITDQGRNFMSSFFRETCKILRIQKTHTSSFHPMSNGLLERWHRSLHEGLSYFVNSSNTNWDNLVQFYLMAYRATPNTVSGYSPLYLLHGREMTLPNHANLKAKVTEENPDHSV